MAKVTHEFDLYGKHYLQLSTGKGAMPVARFGDRLRPFDTTTTHPLALRGRMREATQGRFRFQQRQD